MSESALMLRRHRNGTAASANPVRWPMAWERYRPAVVAQSSGRPYPEAMTSRRKMSALIAQLQEVPDLHGVELVLRTKTLKDALVKVLGEEGDRGVHEALHRGNTTGEQVAEQLDTNVRTLHNRSSRHIARLRGREQQR